jgi:hypothetical protein
MNVEALDAAILSRAGKRWLKAAMIGARALDDLGLPPSDVQFEAVVARMRALVAQGRLLAKGNLSRPRFSEIRLPGYQEE